MTFVDTSAIFAALTKKDPNHEVALGRLRALVAAREVLITTNVVVIETGTLAQRRLGQDAVAVLVNDVLPGFGIYAVDGAIFDGAIQEWLKASRRRLSLVDCISFTFMRSRGIERAFAFDRDYAAAGFTLV